jgi:CHAD domain-containing protein
MTETLRTRMELGGPGEVTDPWMRSLAQKREVALAEMVKALRSERFAALMAQIDSLPTENPTVGEADRRPVSEMAPSWIVNVIRKVLRWQTTDGRDLEPLELHRLRIAFKGARYTCEFFREVLDLDEVDRVLDLFVEYQDCLGKFQDACVAIERLVKLARERWSDEDKRLEEFLFIGGVIGAHRDLADRQRADFHTRWPSFPSKIRRFRRMMRRKAGGSLVPSVQTPPPETPPVSMES